MPLLVQVNEASRRRSGAALATPPTTASAARWAGPRAISWAAAAFSISPAGSRRSGWAAPLDWGLDENICGALAGRHRSGSAKVNYYLGASVRRPAFLSPNNTVTVSLFTERRSEFKVYLRQETGASVALTAHDAEAANPAFAGLHPLLRPNRGHRRELLRVLQRLYPDVIEPLRQNRVLATLTGRGNVPRVNNPIDPTRGSLKSLELTVSSRFLGSSLAPAVHPGRGATRHGTGRSPGTWC